MHIFLISHFPHCNIVSFLYLFDVGWLAENNTLWIFMNMLYAHKLGMVGGRETMGQAHE